MIVTRRGFLTGMLALGVAPAVCRADYVIYIDPASPYGDLTCCTGWERSENGLILQGLCHG